MQGGIHTILDSNRNSGILVGTINSYNASVFSAQVTLANGQVISAGNGSGFTLAQGNQVMIAQGQGGLGFFIVGLFGATAPPGALGQSYPTVSAGFPKYYSSDNHTLTGASGTSWGYPIRIFYDTINCFNQGTNSIVCFLGSNGTNAQYMVYPQSGSPAVYITRSIPNTVAAYDSFIWNNYLWIGNSYGTTGAMTAIADPSGTGIASASASDADGVMFIYTNNHAFYYMTAAGMTWTLDLSNITLSGLSTSYTPYVASFGVYGGNIVLSLNIYNGYATLVRSISSHGTAFTNISGNMYYTGSMDPSGNAYCVSYSTAGGNTSFKIATGGTLTALTSIVSPTNVTLQRPCGPFINNIRTNTGLINGCSAYAAYHDTKYPYVGLFTAPQTFFGGSSSTIYESGIWTMDYSGSGSPVFTVLDTPGTSYGNTNATPTLYSNSPPACISNFVAGSGTTKQFAFINTYPNTDTNYAQGGLYQASF